MAHNAMQPIAPKEIQFAKGSTKNGLHLTQQWAIFNKFTRYQHSVINLPEQKRKCTTHYKTLLRFILTWMNAPYFSPAGCYGDRSILSITAQVIMHDFHSASTTACATCSIWPYAVFLTEEGCFFFTTLGDTWRAATFCCTLLLPVCS